MVPLRTSWGGGRDHVPNHITLAEAAEIMLGDDIHQLVITGPPEGGSVAVGIVTLQDVLQNAD
ncbi:CBS domain-containing protein [Chloroflexota bacterium]